jgi:hypothetical protein
MYDIRSEEIKRVTGSNLYVLRGEPVAELRPIAGPPRIPADKRSRIFDSMRGIWARMPRVSDSTKIIEEDRDR